MKILAGWSQDVDVNVDMAAAGDVQGPVTRASVFVGDSLKFTIAAVNWYAQSSHLR